MGGVRRHNAELLPRVARLLRDRGGRLTILAGATPPAISLEGIELLPSRVPASSTRRGLVEGRALRKALATGRFDLVHTAHLPAPRRLQRPFCLTLHDPRRALFPEQGWPDRPDRPDRPEQPEGHARQDRPSPLGRGRFLTRLGRRAGDVLLRSAFRRAAGVVAVSETMAALYRTRFGARRVAVVPNAADHLPLLPRASDEGDPFLLHVGHLEPRKNLGLLLEVLALAPDLPRLVLAGAAKKDEDQRLRTRARALGVESRVELRGPVDDEELARLYARTACVVLPSWLEGFGIPALEALRAEAPLAVSTAGALPEVAGDVPGFAPNDPEAAARAVRAALRSTGDDRERRAQRARAATWDAAAQRLLAFYCELSGTDAQPEP